MLSIHVQCECNNGWVDRMKDDVVLARRFDDTSKAVIDFKCPYCYRIVPVHITCNDDRTDYVADLPRGHGDVQVSKDPDDFFGIDIDHYLHEILGAEPKRVFNRSIEELMRLINDNSEAINSQIFHRMAYTQVFTILETYLADRLTKIISRDDDALRAILEKLPAWKTKPLTMADAFEAVSIAKKQVLETLLLMNYHRFDKVNPYYKAVLKTDIWANKEDRALLDDFLKIRNDCAHRNGKTVTGEDRFISVRDIIDLVDVVRRMHFTIEEAFDREYFSAFVANSPVQNNLVVTGPPVYT